ncbi:MAG: hypothetical protein ISR76_09045 [Planctomycetes bacterium]|nr:hypothetical protein [Planctomycetota bacterium]
MTRQNGPFPLFLQRFPVVLLVCAGALAAAWWLTGQMEPVYRSQARAFEPASAESFSLSSDSANLPSGPKLPTGNTERQASLMGVLRTAEMRVRVANEIESLTAAELEDRVDFDIDAFNLIVVTAWDSDPRRAAEVANKYFELLQDELQRVTRRDLGSRKALLEGSIAEAEAGLRSAEVARLEYLQASGSVDYQAELQAASGRIQVLREELSRLAVRGDTLDDEAREIAAQRDARPDFVPSSRTEGLNPRLAQLRGELGREEATLAAMLVKQTAEFPQVKAQQERINHIRQELEAEVEVLEDSRSFAADPLRQSYEARLVDLQIEGANLEVQRRAREEQLAEAMKEWQRLPGFQSGLRVFDDEIGRQRAMLETLRLQHAETRLALDGDPAFIELVERAQEASEPYFPNLALNLGIALLFGVLLSALMLAATSRVARWRLEAPW